MAQTKGMNKTNQHSDCLEFDSNDQKESIKVYSFHISCKSDQFTGDDDMMGIILYQYNGQTQWELNGIRCRSGYIYLCKSSHLTVSKDNKSSEYDSMHARCYKRLFGIDPDYSKIVGAGFAYNSKEKEHKWKYNSSTFNSPSKLKEYNP